ncbi:hypothetical protein BGZ75_005760 [Mortierella antarctica]|nr:hypothetical protein BGZ75_005760 [Mortierella antarctica]
MRPSVQPGEAPPGSAQALFMAGETGSLSARTSAVEVQATGLAAINFERRPFNHAPPDLLSSSVSVRSHSSSVHGGPVPSIANNVVKDISFWGGLALLICNTTGPGSVTLPLVAQSAGWVPTLVGFLLIGTLSYLSSMFICEAMTEVPGNDHFQANVEFSNLVLCFFGRRYQVLVQVVCFLALQTTIIASIAICAQLFDNLLIQIFHRTCGIQVHPTASLICVTEQLSSASPFSGVMIMSTGALVAMVLIIPLCLMNLSENIWLQMGSCILILMIMVQWVVMFFVHGIEPARVPAVGSDISQTFGSILFNYAFITAIPSWANAKQPKVSAHKTVGTSVTTMTCLFVLVSILGGMAYDIPANSSLVQAISSAPDSTILSKIAGYTFPIAALITSIPVNMIVVRYNLIQSGTCRKKWANALSGGLPWFFAIPGMTGSGLTEAVNWCSLFLVSAANFVIPFVLYIYSKRHKEKLRRLADIEVEQIERLSREATRSSGHVDHISLVGKIGAGGWKKPFFWSRCSKSCGAQIQTPTISEEENDEKAVSFVVHCQRTADDVEPETGESKETTAAEGCSVQNRERHDKEQETGDRMHGSGTCITAASSYSKSHNRTAHPHHGTHSDAIIAPPFLGGNNYIIPGFIPSRVPVSFSRSSSQLELQRSRSEDPTLDSHTAVGGPGLRASEDRLPEHDRELDTLWSLKAIPQWFPASGPAVAWSALTILLIGIIATIIIKFVQLA